MLTRAATSIRSGSASASCKLALVAFKAPGDLSPEGVNVLGITNTALENLRSHQREAIAPMGFRCAWALESFLQLGIHRMVTLGDGVASEWNHRRYLNAAVLSRHLIESLAVWFRVLDRVHTLLPDKAIREIFVLIMQAMFGRRDDDPVLPQAINVLTCIDKLAAVHPHIRKLYDQLSEFAHPNSDGHLTFAGTMDERTRFMALGAGTDDGLRTLTLSAAGSLYFAVGFLEGYEENIKGPLETMEREFGNVVEKWPGDPKLTWRRS